MHERLCERWRVAATAMWYVMGTMSRADAQEELKAALYDLYEKHGKSVDGLRAELGDRDQAARQGFGLSGWQRGRPGPRQVEETNMTVNELVQELQRLDRPDLDVFIPCPHCCGQRGADSTCWTRNTSCGWNGTDGRRSCWATRASSASRTGGPAAGHESGLLLPGEPRNLLPAWVCNTCGPSPARTWSKSTRTPYRQEQVQPSPPAQPGDRGNGRTGHPLRNGGNAVPGRPGGHRPGPDGCGTDDGAYRVHMPGRYSLRRAGPVGRGGHCFRAGPLASHGTG